jgi:hypothetical protein
MHRFIQYLRYRLKAKSRHGIHSPFVYALVDQCLLAGDGDLLEKRLPDFLMERGFKNITYCSVESKPAEIIGKLSEDIAVLIPGIHSDRSSTFAWNSLRNDHRISLSIDLFDFGLLINKTDFKEKQHFCLKRKLRQ